MRLSAHRHWMWAHAQQLLRLEVCFFEYKNKNRKIRQHDGPTCLVIWSRL